MTFRPRYALAAALLLAVETVIALYVDDAVVRPYLGDSLAVMLVYCGLRAVLPLRVRTAVAAAFAVAVAIELAQAAQLLWHIGLADNHVARVVFGGKFDPADFAAYALGAAAVLAGEAIIARRRAARADTAGG